MNKSKQMILLQPILSYVPSSFDGLVVGLNLHAYISTNPRDVKLVIHNAQYEGIQPLSVESFNTVQRVLAPRMTCVQSRR